MEPVHQPSQPAPTATPPVMDVVPPRPAAPAAPAAPAVQTPTAPEPVKMPPQEASVVLPISKLDDSKPKKADKPTVAKPPKQPRSGSGALIVATVIIVLGLGLMMTYAYLRTNGISLF